MCTFCLITTKKSIRSPHANTISTRPMTKPTTMPTARQMAKHMEAYDKVNNDDIDKAGNEDNGRPPTMPTTTLTNRQAPTTRPMATLKNRLAPTMRPTTRPAMIMPTKRLTNRSALTTRPPLTPTTTPTNRPA